MEQVEIINQRLIDYYGYFESGDKPNYRLVYSNNQFEMILDTFRDYVPGTNIFVREVTEFREVRKYPYLKNKWVLEKILPAPEQLTTNLTYESIWVFGKKGDPYGESIEPKWIAIQFVIDGIHEAMAKAGSPFPKYTPRPIEQNDPEGLRLRYNEIYEALYGNESNVTDSLMQHSGVFIDSKKVM